MSLVSRVKRLWELSGTPELTYGDLLPPLYVSDSEPISQVTTGELEAGEVVIFTPAPRRMATVVQDDPLDAFPAEDPDHEGDVT